MNKDTIYIDVEDDITAIIGKVKAANNKIVALVPPKRIGVLQSAVNLRLLARAAKQNQKHLVLISGNSALMALAASAGIPSARTLQSKPEMPTLPDEGDDTGEDIIDGSELPVGDIARTDTSVEPASEALTKGAPAIDSAIRANAAEEASAAPLPRPPKATRNGIKVPNFDTFRKKLALGIGGLLLLVSFLVWAVWFAPQATIAITARTIESSANPKVILAEGASTDMEAGTIKAIRYEIEQEATMAFEATGSKEVGEKAEGTVVFRNCKSTLPVKVEAGTGVSASGFTYITQSTVSVPGFTADGGCNPGVSEPVSVVAQDIGEDYNTDEGTQFSVSGQQSVGPFTFRAVADEDIDGGSRRDITIVTQEDIDKAADQLIKQSTESAKSQLLEKFGEDAIAIDSTFSGNKDKVASAPAADQEAKEDQASLTGSIVFSMVGVTKSEASIFLDAYFEEELEDSENQRVYDNGVDKTSFLDVKSVDNGFTATMAATAKFGPKVDDDAVKEQARGKKLGDVQSAIEQVSGVEDVNVRFSPFWVRTVPNDKERITVEFKLNESE